MIRPTYQPVMLITLAQAKEHLRYDDFDSSGNPQDANLTLYILAASSAVLNYIRSSSPDFLDTAGYPEFDTSGAVIGLPDVIRIAMLLLVGDFDKNRNAGNESEWTMGFLPTSVQALLFPYRLPTLA